MRSKLLFFVLCLFASSSFASTVENLAIVKKRLRQYHDSGAYARDLEREVMGAKRYLKSRIAQNKKLAHPKRLAIVFDIDETALSNYRAMEKLDFGGSHKQEMTLYKSGKDTAILPTLDLFNYAKQNNVAVFFVTGRPEWSRALTVKNLHKEGFFGWEALILEKNDYHEKSAVPYKTHARKAIEDKGYDIVLTMGDQMSDLKGGYADNKFLLSNPFYYLP